jgi:hypothetical protein
MRSLRQRENALSPDARIFSSDDMLWDVGIDNDNAAPQLLN